MTLTIHGSQPSTVFRLIGADENSASFALGWVLERSPNYRNVVVEAAFGKALDAANAVIALQRHAEDGGYTDVEIQSGNRFHAILEAKRWWQVPSETQLRRYMPRLHRAPRAEHQLLISVSAAEKAMAARWLPAALEGIPIVHLSWADLQHLAQKAYARASRFEEKLWIGELGEHFREFTSMERQIDNKVFVVSLAHQAMRQGQPYTWIDVVEKDKCYFHPVGHNWPVQPPNYIGFRYGGMLQSVHHIESFDIVENVATINPRWVDTDADHFVYRLGPPMRPARQVNTGKVYRNGRVWCAIDTLLSGAYATISEARDVTQGRSPDR